MNHYKYSCPSGHRHKSQKSADNCFYCKRFYRYLCPKDHKHSSQELANSCFHCYSIQKGSYFKKGSSRSGGFFIRRNLNPLIRILFQEAAHQEVSLGILGKKSGVSSRTIKSWGKTRDPRLANFEACVNTLDLELCIKRKEKKPLSEPALQRLPPETKR